MQLLKLSTATTIKFGPFLDSTDGVVEETGLTVAQADIRLSKNGGNIAQSNNVAGATHDELGYYDVPLDTTDTNALGRLKVAVHDNTAHLPVWNEYMVVPANVYDALVGGSDVLQVHATEISNDLITAAAIATNAIGATEIAAGAIAADAFAAGAIDATAIANGAIDAATFAAGAIDATAIATGAIDADAIAANAIGASEIADGAIDAGAIASDAITAAKIANGAIDAATFAAGAIDATAIASNAITAAKIATDAITSDELATSAVTKILTTQMTEAYAADGAAPTLAQALMMIQQMLGDFTISSTTLTVRKVDGAASAATYTLNDATNPTALTRAS